MWVVFCYYVECQIIFNLWCGVGQYGKVVVEYMCFMEYCGGLSIVYLFECVVQFGGSFYIKVGVQFVVGVIGVQCLCYVVY